MTIYGRLGFVAPQAPCFKGYYLHYRANNTPYKEKSRIQLAFFAFEPCLKEKVLWKRESDPKRADRHRYRLLYRQHRYPTHRHVDLGAHLRT